MLNITKRVDYGLIALAHLAIHAGARLSAREVAEAYGLSQPLLANVLKELARGEVVVSVRGTKGGYELAQPADEITVGRVVELLEGSLRLTECVGHEPRDHQLGCGVSRQCPVRRSVFKIHLRIRDVLYGVSIAELARDAARPGAALPVAYSSRAARER